MGDGKKKVRQMGRWQDGCVVVCLCRSDGGGEGYWEGGWSSAWRVWLCKGWFI